MLWRASCSHERAMNAKAEELKARTKRFALAALGFTRTLPNTNDARDIGRQLARAATAVAANYRATCRSRSAPEFVARIGIALEEADEASFWLEVIVEDRLSTGREVLALLDEAGQLTAILAASRITVSKRLSR
jgi:four helix bundle protein